jgi:hypothetical protein
MERPLILVTNDDGIDSAGLWAAAEALMPLGDVLVVAADRPLRSGGLLDLFAPGSGDAPARPSGGNGRSGLRAATLGMKVGRAR